jgi:glyoxylate utilization-related uncharacterized protein
MISFLTLFPLFFECNNDQAAISMSGQLDLFKDYIVKLKGVVGEDRTNFILANSIFFVVLGSNDISNTYYLSHLRQVHYDLPTYSDLLVNSAYNFYKVKYGDKWLFKCYL